MQPRKVARKAIDLARRGYNKSPHVIAMWLWRKYAEKRAANRLPKLAARMTAGMAAQRLGYTTPALVFEAALSSPPFPLFHSARQDIADALDDSSKAEILERAKAAMAREVRFLGSDTVTLSTPVDWATDFKSGISWPMIPSRDLEVLDLDRPSDIKIPWELSRLQWLLPAGQAYMLTEDEAYADFACDIVNEWFDANPICVGPNWLCAMDVSMRAMSMAWLFYACADSKSWSDPDFRDRLLVQLTLHAEYVLENLEWSDIAGNHLTTDLAGLVVIGLMLGGKGRAEVWIDKGWRLLEEQFPMQVPDDGVCREASVPYHRLVGELFLLPALARRACGLPVDDAYWRRLDNMAPFIDAYSRADGGLPVWGDADDGRALPLGTQALNDHRYLSETLRSLKEPSRAPEWDETLWWLGPGTAKTPGPGSPKSTCFRDAGVYVMRNAGAHIFIDAGPVGMGGRGGHGHNDCLSFEAFLKGHPLIVDPGCYVYTSDWRARNAFRGTAAHNTPMIDGQEINRIPRDDWLWYLENDAIPEIRHWNASDDADILVASHTGYRRLADPVTPVRAVMLDRAQQRLVVADRFEGTGDHDVRIRYTFAPGSRITEAGPGSWRITQQETTFILAVLAPEKWHAEIGEAMYSPSYGVRMPVPDLSFCHTGPLQPLAMVLMPEDSMPADPAKWLDTTIQKRFRSFGFQA
jgi:hypothetical protein